MLNTVFLRDRMMDKVGIARMLESLLEVIKAGVCRAIYRSAPDAVAAAALNMFCWVQSVFQKGKAGDDLKN
tara:strand:- start:112 stop:324 length:213 start_codon:yes stop_codon:yes gene_type:complete